ncbi:hypothetical protein [Laceyella putida]|uniref:Uncharacterized protein n=1 Tax=Laceyella putida TaxID=110101 RepID=A0ABW2RK64_9BACL
MTVIHGVLKLEEVQVGMSVSIVVEGKLLTDRVAMITDEHLVLGVAIPKEKIDQIFDTEKRFVLQEDDLDRFVVRPEKDVPSS